MNHLKTETMTLQKATTTESGKILVQFLLAVSSRMASMKIQMESLTQPGTSTGIHTQINQVKLAGQSFQKFGCTNTIEKEF